MSLYMMKASQNEDFYILMSTVVDAPVLFGTLEQLYEANNDLNWKVSHGFNSSTDFVEMAQEADKHGSSSFIGNGTWDAENIIFANLGNHSTNTEYWELPREKVSDFFKEYVLDYSNKDYEEMLLNKYCTPMGNN